MRTPRLKAALFSATAVLALLVPGSSAVAGPSAAPPGAPVLGVALTGTVLLPGETDEPNIQFTISDPLVREVDNLQVTLDTGALPAGLIVDTSNEFNWDCVTSASTVVCTAPPAVTVGWSAGIGTGSVNAYLFLHVTASAGSAVTAGSVTATATATGLNTATDTAQYSVAEAVRMSGLPSSSVSGPPGFRYAKQWAVTNTGQTTVHGVVLVMDNGSLSYTEHYRNCWYAAHNHAYCVFNNDLAPGQAYQISTAMGFQISPTHVAPWQDVTFGSFSTLAGLYDQPPGTAGDGPPLSLVLTSTGAPAPALTQAGRPQVIRNVGAGSAAGYIEVAVTGSQAADLAAVGARVQSHGVNQPVTVPLGVRDAGPADASLSRNGEPLTYATVTLPTGSIAAAVPLACAPIIDGRQTWDDTGLPGYQVYACSINAPLDVNQVFPLPFAVQTLVDQPAYIGSISLGAEGASTADNTASFTIQSALPVRQPDPGDGRRLPPNNGGPPPAGPRH